MNVLVVDDRAENLYLLSELLKSRGFEVVTAQNGREALEKLAGQEFGLIISDIMMPEMDGFQFCRAVKRKPETASIPFVFYTATYTEPQDEAFALSLGATAFIVKPTEPDEFVRNIDEVINPAAENNPMAQEEPRADDDFLQRYTDRLVRKLEDKVAELQEKTHALEDITNTLEERVQAATKELSEKNKDLESFAYSISHDSRAPLRSIAGMAEILVDELGPSLDANKKQMLETITQKAEQMNSMIQGLLAYSRVSAAELTVEPVSLHLALAEAVQQLAFKISTAKANLDFPDRLPTVLAHKAALVQVLVNLFDNALKFVAPGVVPSVQVSASQEGDRVRVEIKDNGIGISPEDHARVFQVFERLESQAYSGSGVGLAIVRRAIEKMGGSILLQSEPHKGSTFILQLLSSKEATAIPQN